MKIKIKNKKLKRRLKRILVKVTPWRKKYVLDKIPVFSVKQICKIINIKVPEKYKDIQNIPVHKTYLFDKLEDKENVLKKISYHNYRRPNYMRQLKFKMNRFKFGFDNQAEILNATDEKLIQMMVEWLYGFFPIGFYYFDYLDYELYRKSIKEANTFLSREFWWRVYKASNDGKKIKILKDKEQFNKVFHKYVNREFLNSDNCTYEEFEKFVKVHPKFFGKPVEGTGGEGAGIIRVSDFSSIDELYKHSKKNHLIIEEIVEQHKDLAKFNDSAVNTIRAYSLHCADGKVRVLLANLRLSRKGKDVDNFHCGGVTCVIDTKTGKVVSDAIDRHHKFYTKHPDSGIKFKGFQIPCWDKLVKAIEECGSLIPGLRHIGWDIAITKDGNVELIEGNSMPNFDVTQAADQVGKLHVYEKYILELEEIRKAEKKAALKEKNIKKSFSIAEICEIMGIKVPKKVKSIQDIKCTNITLRRGDLDKGAVYFGGYDIIESSDYYDKIFEKGAVVIFMDPKNYKKFPPRDDQPVILLKKYVKMQGKFFNYVKEQYNIPTIAITGSIGKTTTTQLLNCIFSEKYNIFKYSGNWNTCSSIANHIMTGLSPDNNMYIQECGAGDLLSIEKSAAMLRPDAYILTNVLPHHLNKYKTVENVFKDKTSISKYLKPNGVMVTNFDDERIANHKFHHKVISVGINTKENVDYRATNIVQNNEYLELDVLYGNDKSCHIKMNIFGKHNAYNILFAFAMAIHYGIDEKTIQKGILKFRTSGIRQNVRNIGGVTFFIDCYNVCNDSIKAMIKTVEETNVPKGAKRIAVLGGENKLGADYEKISYQLGEELKDNKLDHIICYSLADDTQESIDYYGESKPVYKALIDNGYKNVSLITNRKDLVKELRKLLKPGDICLIKGNAELDMTLAIDEIYGTSMTMDHEYKPERNIIVQDMNYKMKVNMDLGMGSIFEYLGNDIKEITIPDEVEGYPVFRVGKKLFSEKENLEKVNFGNSIQNIGISAFARNNGIKELHIPGNVKWISAYAFAHCSNLEKVVIEEGLINISKYAFLNCTSLKEIELPKSVKVIDSNAFKGVNELTIVGSKSSLAEQYAKDNQINFKLRK